MKKPKKPLAGDARGHRASDRYDERGFPIKARGELGPPGIGVTRYRPTVPFAETVASCLACRRLVLCIRTLADGASSLWGMTTLDRLEHRAFLRISGAWTGQEFAEGCDCGIAPHGRDS